MCQLQSTHLGLTNNHIEDVGAEALMAALRANDTIKYIEIGILYCGVGTDGLRALRELQRTKKALVIM